MALLIPASRNYPSPLVTIPANYGREPLEGRKIVPIEIDWASMGGPGNTVAVNLGNNATMPFSQILAMKIDNSLCGADIQIIFPDTSDTLSIPAYSPAVIIPCFTSGTSFYVNAPNEIAIDVTRIQVLNFTPPPVTVPTSDAQNVAAVPAVTLGNGTTPLVAAGISGTMESVYINCAFNGAVTAGAAQFAVQDGTGKALAVTGLSIPGGAQGIAVLLNLNPTDIRFVNGINLVQTGVTAPGTSVLFVNLYYRKP